MEGKTYSSGEGRLVGGSDDWVSGSVVDMLLGLPSWEPSYARPLKDETVVVDS